MNLVQPHLHAIPRLQAHPGLRVLTIALLLVCTKSHFHVCAAEPPPRTTLSDPAQRFTVPDQSYVILRNGSVSAVIVDNRAVNDAVLPGHRAGYSGVASLTHEQQPRNLFVPAYAGLNFEHIHDGSNQRREVLFEPRNAPMELRSIDATTADLYQPATPFWGLESCHRYRLLPDGILEVTFECIPRRVTFKNGYIGLFWASYIDHPESLDIHFRGVDESEAGKGRTRWIQGITPQHGALATHRGLGDDRGFMKAPDFPLELPFGFSNHRFTEPWYFGRCRGMAYVQAFRPSDAVRLSQSPSGGGNGCPAWDFQWFIEYPVIGQRYQFVMRAAYLPAPAGTDLESTRRPIARFVKRHHLNRH